MVGDRVHEVSDAATAIFEQQWQVYRKMVDNNYLCHREVYGLLHDVLIRDLLIEIVIMVIGPLLSAAAWYWLAAP